MLKLNIKQLSDDLLESPHNLQRLTPIEHGNTILNRFDSTVQLSPLAPQRHSFTSIFKPTYLGLNYVPLH